MCAKEAISGTLTLAEFVSHPLWPSEISADDRRSLRTFWPKIATLRDNISGFQNLSFWLLINCIPGVLMWMIYFVLASSNNPLRLVLERWISTFFWLMLLGALSWLVSRLLVRKALRTFPEAKRLHSVLSQLEWRLQAAALFPSREITKRIEFEGLVLDDAFDHYSDNAGEEILNDLEGWPMNSRAPVLCGGPWDGKADEREMCVKAFQTYPLPSLYYEFVHTSHGWGIWSPILLWIVAYYACVRTREDIGPGMSLVHVLFWSNLAACILIPILRSRRKFDWLSMYMQAQG